MVQEGRKEGQEEEGKDGAEAASNRDAEGSSAEKAAEPSAADGDHEMRESDIQVCPGMSCCCNAARMSAPGLLPIYVSGHVTQPVVTFKEEQISKRNSTLCKTGLLVNYALVLSRHEYQGRGRCSCALSAVCIAVRALGPLTPST